MEPHTATSLSIAAHQTPSCRGAESVRGTLNFGPWSCKLSVAFPKHPAAGALKGSRDRYGRQYSSPNNPFNLILSRQCQKDGCLTLLAGDTYICSCLSVWTLTIMFCVCLLTGFDTSLCLHCPPHVCLTRILTCLNLVTHAW